MYSIRIKFSRLFNPNTSDLEFGISVLVFFRCLEFPSPLFQFKHHPNRNVIRNFSGVFQAGKSSVEGKNSRLIDFGFRREIKEIIEF